VPGAELDDAVTVLGEYPLDGVDLEWLPVLVLGDEPLSRLPHCRFVGVIPDLGVVVPAHVVERDDRKPERLPK